MKALPFLFSTEAGKRLQPWRLRGYMSETGPSAEQHEEDKGGPQ